MEIRKTQFKDLKAVLDIYSKAREFMVQTGNPSQWGDLWPPVSLVEDDIRQQKSYVCVEKTPVTGAEIDKVTGIGIKGMKVQENILAVFFLEVADDPTYHKIYDGQWLDEKLPYGVIHRIASSGQVRGAGEFCLEWALEHCGNIRIDTHEANAPMKNLLKKLGYTYCGTINTHDGTPRLAFQKVARKTVSKFTIF